VSPKRRPPPGLDVDLVDVDGETILILSWPAGKHPAAELPLTSAEQAVLRKIVAGWSNAEIAAARGTSTRTVANQVASLLRKFRVTSRHQLVRRALAS
jgi:DNA-binding NarL/FixJ family response regulator